MKSKILFAFICITFSITYISFLSKSINAEWWNSSWNLRKPIDINSTITGLTYYQVKLRINLTDEINSGKIASNCGDIRFVNSTGNEIDYYIELCQVGKNSIIWVEVPQVNDTIYMYYNSSFMITRSNPNATFLFWDNFTFPFPEANKWELGRGNWLNNNTFKGYMLTTSGPHTRNGYLVKYVGDIGNTIQNFTIEAELNYFRDYDVLGLGGTFLARMVDGIDPDGASEDYWMVGWSNNDNYWFANWVKNHDTFGIPRTNTSCNPEITDSVNVSWSFASNGNFKFYCNNGTQEYLIFDFIDKNLTTAGRIGVKAYGDYPHHWDNIKIARYTDPEPTYTIGAEEPFTCTVGWKCKDFNIKGYQYENCSWSNLEFCEFGCINGRCKLPPPKNLTIKSIGELDYFHEEDVNIRIAVLIKDKDTREPVSNANVSINIYDPSGNLWIFSNMTERINGSGIYEWESEKTIHELRKSKKEIKGVYLAYIKASYGNGTITTDIAEFHIDPPANSYIQLISIFLIIINSIILLKFIIEKSKYYNRKKF